MRDEFLTTFTTKIAVFWEVMPYNLVEFYQCSLTTYQEGIREEELKKKKAGRDVKKKTGIEHITKGRQAGRQKTTEKRGRRKKKRKTDTNRSR